jgi:transglutaminase-like putative cysteine protease
MNASALPGPQHLASTHFIDHDHPAVQAFAREHALGSAPRERAAALYLAVRDRVRYDPYRIDLSARGMSASHAIELGHGWCVPKAVLLAAVCRADGIPARLGFADVRNHLSTERLRKTMGTDVFAWHGYASIWLDGAWRKATPAFNIELCEKFGLLPLEFDGSQDSLYHPFDREGRQHMEYVNERGAFDDLPLAPLCEAFRLIYPNMPTADDVPAGDFAADAEREASGSA